MTDNFRVLILETMATDFITGMATVSVANSNRDGTGTLATVYTAGSSTYLLGVRIVAQGTTTDGMVRIFLDNGLGAIMLVKEIVVAAVTPSATVPTYSFVGSLGYTIPKDFIVKASTEKAESINVIISGSIEI